MGVSTYMRGTVCDCWGVDNILGIPPTAAGRIVYYLLLWAAVECEEHTLDPPPPETVWVLGCLLRMNPNQALF